jgi:DNA-binding NarL/FixJ family response regulator
MNEARSVTVLLADEWTLVREGLARLIEADSRFRVIAQASDGASALKLIETLRPAIGIVDINLPDLFALELVRRATVASPETKLIVVSTRRDRKTVVESLRAGASGFVLKSAHGHQLLDALGQVLEGGVYVSPSLELNKIFAPAARNGQEDPLESLSAREYQVFSLLIDGVRAKEIAARLELSPKTVDTYRASLMRKLDIHDVPGLVKFAIHREIISTSP